MRLSSHFNARYHVRDGHRSRHCSSHLCCATGSPSSEQPTPKRKVEERMQTFRKRVDENLGRVQNSRRTFNNELNRPSPPGGKESRENTANVDAISLSSNHAKLRGGSQKTVAVTFKLGFHCEPWQHIRIVGSHQCLGNWKLASALVMSWGEGHIWEAKVHLPAGGVYEYKYVLCEDRPGGAKALVWQSGNNSVLAISSNEGPTAEVQDNWAGEPGAVVLSHGDDDISGLVTTSTREKKLLKYVEETETTISQQNSEISSLQAEIEMARADLRSLRASNSTMKKQMVDLEVNLQEERLLRQELESALQDLQDVVEGTYSSLEIRKSLREAEASLAEKEEREAELEEINSKLQQEINKNSASFHDTLTTFQRLIDVAMEQ